MAIQTGSNLGQLLIDEKLINKDQLAQAEENRAKQGGSLGFNLALLGAISEEEVGRFVAMTHGLEYADLSSIQVDPAVLKLVSEKNAVALTALAIARKSNSVVLAVVDPSDEKLEQLVKELKFKHNLGVVFAIAPESYIKISIEHYYGQLKASGVTADENVPSHYSNAEESAKASYQEKTAPAAAALDLTAIMEKAGTDAELTMMDDKKGDDDLAAEGAPDDSIVIRICNTIISDAVMKKASDIHFEPFEKELIVRFRIDGSLRAQPAPPTTFRRAIVARFKVMAKLNIMERRKPQDGRIKIMVAGRKIDLRVATCPVLWGEKVVMRILDQENLQTDLNKLGFENEDLARFKEAIFNPYGIVLVTGPTGSGKTVTLYSALSTVQDPEDNIMTAEDPIEYNLVGINQVPVNPEIGMTFPAALKSFLRCDPDIILVGEIRDIETGSIAIKAAMTGHLVISTMHTNDAPSAVNRMIDMGIDPFYIGTAVKAIVAQRLMRKICYNCKVPATIPDAVYETMKIPRDFFEGHQVFEKGPGCNICNNTGHKGRTAIYEVMPFTDTIIKKVLERGTAAELKDLAVAQGMNTLRISALKKVRAGDCSLAGVAEMTSAD
jgi:type IV pilus assembly protein PilB